MTEKQFLNKLKKENPILYKNIEIVKLNNSTEHSIFKYKYGDIKLFYYSLFRNSKTLIRSAINKTEYWVNWMKDIRNDWDNIDYSKVTYITNKNKVNLKCKIHNYKYTQAPKKHKENVQGCPFCSNKTLMYNEQNFKKHSEFFKNKKGILYVLEMFNESENFFKIGICGSNSFKYRKNKLAKIYNIKEAYYEENDLYLCYCSEQKLLKEFSHKKYNPLRHFKGYTECLTVNPITEIMGEKEFNNE